MIIIFFHYILSMQLPIHILHLNNFAQFTLSHLLLITTQITTH